MIEAIGIRNMPQHPPNSLEPWLRLHHAPGIGPVTGLKLLQQFGDPSEILGASAKTLAAAGLNESSIGFLKNTAVPTAVRAGLEWQQSDHHSVLCLSAAHYPSQLRQLRDPPLVLYVIGDPEVLHWPQLAVVGSRNPSPDGLRHADQFARFIGNAGLTITSGLAQGIDAAAHRAALAVSSISVAVMATGADRIYPSSHQQLAREISESGAIVTEYPVGAAARPQHFPKRNRIITGLSQGVLVIEAAVKSGSLISARHAVEQGREVFAIPGSIHNPLARGCHQLIRNGAKLVETAADILEELAPQLTLTDALSTEPDMSPPHITLTDPEYQLLWPHIGFDPQPVDVLVANSGLAPQAVASMLLRLELEEFVICHPGRRYARGRDLPTHID